MFLLHPLWPAVNTLPACSQPPGMAPHFLAATSSLLSPLAFAIITPSPYLPAHFWTSLCLFSFSPTMCSIILLLAHHPFHPCFWCFFTWIASFLFALPFCFILSVEYIFPESWQGNSPSTHRVCTDHHMIIGNLS